MSRAHKYHQPNAPNIFPEGPDSDIELDLQELGPRGSSENGKALGNNNGQRGHSAAVENSGHIPLQNLRASRLRSSGRRTRKLDRGQEDAESSVGAAEEPNYETDLADSSEAYNIGDATPLLHSDVHEQTARARSGLFWHRFHLPKFLSRSSGYTSIEDESADVDVRTSESGTPRSINIGQHPARRFPPNAVSNAKYTPWSFLPRTLYNEFSFFINMYFLLVSLSQIIKPLRIGVLWSYIVPLAFVLTITLGKEAFDDIARRRRDSEANKELYTILRLRDVSKDSLKRNNRSGKALRLGKTRTRSGTANQQRLDAIEEEEENVGHNSSGMSNIEMDEIHVRSRDLKVGDVVKLGKGQRVPADLIILKSLTTESAVASTLLHDTNAESAIPLNLLDSQTVEGPKAALDITETLPEQPKARRNPLASGDHDRVGETFIRTDQLDGETDWKLRLASPLTQSLDPRDFIMLTIVAGKPVKKVNEFVGKIELTSRKKDLLSQHPPLESNPVDQTRKVLTAPLTIDNTAWANTVLASSTTVLAVVVYTGAQTRQALSTSASRSKVGLLELEINNLTKLLCALTLTLSAVLVGLQYYYTKSELPWYVSVTRFLILFSTIIPISLRVNLDLGKSVYAWFIERDHDMPGAVVRTSTIPEDLGRIEYLLSDKTGTLTQNGNDTFRLHSNS